MAIEAINNNYVQFSGNNKKRKASPLTVAVCALPVIDSVSKGIVQQDLLANGKMGSRLLSSAKCLGSWGVGIGCVLGITKLKDLAVNKSDSLSKFNYEHPFVAMLADIAIILGTFAAGKAGFAALKNKFPNMGSKLSEKIYKIQTKLDNGKLNDKIVKPMTDSWNKFAGKSPKLADFTKGAIKNAAWITLAGTAIASMLKPVNKQG